MIPAPAPVSCARVRLAVLAAVPGEDHSRFAHTLATPTASERLALQARATRNNYSVAGSASPTVVTG